MSLPIPILAPYCVLPAVQVLSALGDDSGAAELQGAFAPTLEVLRFTFPPEWLRSHDAALERVRRHREATTSSIAAWSAAPDSTSTEPPAWVLAALEPYRTAEADPGLEPDPDGHPSPSSSAANPLTERQTEVVRLIAEGLTNPEIAAKLGVSVKDGRAPRLGRLPPVGHPFPKRSGGLGGPGRPRRLSRAGKALGVVTPTAPMSG